MPVSGGNVPVNDTTERKMPGHKEKGETNMQNLRRWKFENGIRVNEEIDQDGINYLDVYNGDSFLGSIFPADRKDMEMCCRDLDTGKDPITYGWRDGLGNDCTLDGWQPDPLKLLYRALRNGVWPCEIFES